MMIGDAYAGQEWGVPDRFDQLRYWAVREQLKSWKRAIRTLSVLSTAQFDSTGDIESSNFVLAMLRLLPLMVGSCAKV